jgi:biopolymer transport protein ExbB
MEGTVDSVLRWFELGGPVVVVLAAMSVFALAIGILKLWQFAALRVSAQGFIEQAIGQLRQGETDRALSLLAQQRSPIANVMAITIQERLRGQLSEPLLREEAARLAVRHLENLRSYLRPLEVIGVLAPLLGLLGTVLGMIEAFQQMQAAGARVDPSILSGGIWEALLTTAVGLAVAIPVVMALNWLERIVERFRHRMEDALTQVFIVPIYPQAQQHRPELIAQQAHAH